MLAVIVTVNGVKKIVKVTADAGAGNPVGSLLHTYKKSNPSGYLYCDGSTFDQTKYPLLYAYLGSNVLPDYRECVEVGAEQNTTDTIADHDIYTEGQFKDDQLQEHKHNIPDAIRFASNATSGSTLGVLAQSGGSNIETSNNTGRTGTTTHGKQKAVFVYIKATSGLSENAQDNVINTLNEQRSYSTEEVNTGKKWIDGKPIYRKVLPATLFTKGVQLNIQIGTNIEKGWVDFTHSYIYNTNGSFSGQRQPWNQTSMFVEGNNFYFTTEHSDFSNTTYIVAVVEYTKTTD